MVLTVRDVTLRMSVCASALNIGFEQVSDSPVFAQGLNKAAVTIEAALTLFKILSFQKKKCRNISLQSSSIMFLTSTFFSSFFFFFCFSAPRRSRSNPLAPLCSAVDLHSPRSGPHKPVRLFNSTESHVSLSDKAGVGGSCLRLPARVLRRCRR